jgi:hypothetical protein
MNSDDFLASIHYRIAYVISYTRISCMRFSFYAYYYHGTPGDFSSIYLPPLSCIIAMLVPGSLAVIP